MTIYFLPAPKYVKKEITMSTNLSYTCLDFIQEQHQEQFAKDVYAGLTASQKYLKLKYTYDQVGSMLFEKITQSEHYYPTRTEEAILRENAKEIVQLLSADTALIELGTGSALKTRHLIEALLSKQRQALFVPIDISRDFLFANVKKLCEDYPNLQMLGIAADYDTGLEVVAERVKQPRLIIWLGSDVGQTDYTKAAMWLKEKLVRWLNPEDRLLIGIDLKKPLELLSAAYAFDSKPLNKAFISNTLLRINRELGGNFGIEGFQRHCYYDADIGCVKIHLECTQAQQVNIKALDLNLDFAVGDRILMRCAYKYDQTDIEHLATVAGLHLKKQWFDIERLFSVNLFTLNEN